MDEENEIVFHITKDDITKAKAENEGKSLTLLEITLDDGRVFEGIFRKSTPKQFQRYLAASSKKGVDDAGHKASVAFIRDLIVKPDFDEFFELQKQLPALAISVGNTMAEGMGIAADSKKKTI